jgi:hypothetical protein
MTVNERLYVSGLIDAFDKAAELQDVATVVHILREVELTDTSIKPILEEMNLERDCVNLS